MYRYTEEQKKFIIDNNYGKYAKELAAAFNEKFKTNITAKEIKYFRHNHKLNSGLTGQFQKGHITHNKGKKQIEYMTKEAIERTKATRFKKGNKPQNYRPVGSERIAKDGYIEVKVADPNVWKSKHRYIWEQTNGEIPKGHKLIFLDGDKNNMALDNLKIISNNENLIMNTNDLRYNKKELTETAHLIAKIISKGTKNERL